MNAIRILKPLVWFLPLSFFCCTSVRQTSNNLLSSRLPSPPPPHPPHHHHLPPHIKHGVDRLLKVDEQGIKIEPGTKYNYSNFGYFLLGLIIEKESVMSYAQYLKENIFDIAGMSDTKVADKQKTIDNSLASGYARYQSNFVNTDQYVSPLAQIYFSAGNIISTVKDLNKWYQALFINYQIIKKSYLDMAHTPHISISETLSYGYGWLIDDSLAESEEGVKEKRIIWHNGQIPNSFTSNITFNPHSKTLVILLSNINYSLTKYIGNSLIDYVASKVYEYAIESIDQPSKKPGSASKVRTLRNSDRQLLENLMDFNNDPSKLPPMRERLKDIR